MEPYSPWPIFLRIEYWWSASMGRVLLTKVYFHNQSITIIVEMDDFYGERRQCGRNTTHAIF